MKRLLLCMFALCATLQLYSQKVYNIQDYGAVPNGKTLATEAINQAVTECNKNGGGQVYVPTGEYVSGTIFLKDNVELYLERGSTLFVSTNMDDFPLVQPTTYRSLKDWYGWTAFIYADGAKNIAIRGYGAINGQGAVQPSRPEFPKGDMDGRCRNILLVSCKDVRIEGIKMYNSALWNQHYLNCEDVIVDRIYVYNNSRKNNDGIDIDGCRRFILSNSNIDANDDAVVLKATGPAACENITISNCVLASWCNGVKAGTESTGGFKNITVSNCVLKHSLCLGNYQTPDQNRLCFAGIALENVDGGTMEGVAISNIVTERVQCPIFIRLGNRARKHQKDAPEVKMGAMRNISINNFIAYDCENISNSITAIPGAYIENVTISGVQLRTTGSVTQNSPEKKMKYLKDIYEVEEKEKSYPEAIAWGNLPSSLFFIRHAKNVIIKDVIATPNANDPRTPIIAHDVKGLIIGDFILSDKITSPLFFHGYDVKNFKIERPLGWTSKVQKIEKFQQKLQK